MKLLKRRYNDEALVRAAERALGDVPTVDLSSLAINSEGGIVTLTGRVGTDLAHRHALDAVRKAYQMSGLKHEQIVDKISVGRLS
jgi:osmotically-inducible protein OsmY